MEQSQFAPPCLATLEEALAAAISLQRGRVFVDLWDLERFSECTHCFAGRLARLREINLQQSVSPRVQCEHCGDSHV